MRTHTDKEPQERAAAFSSTTDHFLTEASNSLLPPALQLAASSFSEQDTIQRNTASDGGTGGYEEDSYEDEPAYEDSFDACMAEVDLAPDDDSLSDYPKIVWKNGPRTMDNLFTDLPRHLYAAEKAILQKMYKGTIDVDAIRIDWSGDDTRHQLAGSHQIRMGEGDFHWYKVAKIEKALDCEGYNIVEEWIPGQLKIGSDEIAGALVHEGFHIHQRGRGINVTWEWFKSLGERGDKESNDELYAYDESITDAQALWEHFQGLNFEARSEVYEDFYKALKKPGSGPAVDKFEYVVRFVIGDQTSAWSAIVASMR